MRIVFAIDTRTLKEARRRWLYLALVFLISVIVF